MFDTCCHDTFIVISYPFGIINKVAGYKINWKRKAFLYTNNKYADKETRYMTPFTTPTNNIKYLGVTLTKQVKDPYDKNFKSLVNKIESDTRRWIDLPCSWIGGINGEKKDILQKSIYRFNGIPFKISTQGGLRV